MFNDYDKFVEKITAVFNEVDEKREAEWKLNYLTQIKLASVYATEFRQIISVLDWNNKAYMMMYYWELKNENKDEIVKN